MVFVVVWVVVYFIDQFMYGVFVVVNDLWWVVVCSCYQVFVYYEQVVVMVGDVVFDDYV